LFVLFDLFCACTINSGGTSLLCLCYLNKFVCFFTASYDLIASTLREKLHVPAEQFKAYFLALLADKDFFPCYRIGIEGFSFPLSSSLGWHSQREIYVPSRITGAEFAIP